MNPTRQRRLVFVVSILVAVTAAVGLALFALSRNMSYLFTPSQVEAGQARDYRTFRLGGMVQAGSIRHDDNSLRVHFTVVDAGGSMPVVYDGILPDLFRARQAVIATGHMDGDHFVATQVLAKHDATYMPKELKDAMAKAHAGRRIAANAAIEKTP